MLNVAPNLAREQAEGNGEDQDDIENKPPQETRAEKWYNEISALTNKDANAMAAIATFQEVACRVPRCVCARRLLSAR